MLLNRILTTLLIVFVALFIFVSPIYSQVMPVYSLKTKVYPENIKIFVSQKKILTYTVSNAGNNLSRASFELVPNIAITIVEMPNSCKYFILNTTTVVCNIGEMKQGQSASFTFTISPNTSITQSISLVGRAYSQVGLLPIRSNEAKAVININHFLLPSPTPTPLSSEYPRPTTTPSPYPSPIVIPSIKPSLISI